MSATPNVAETAAAPSATDPGPPRPSRAATGSGPLLLRLHFYAGVLVAPFLLVAALTGLAYTITPQLERFVYQDQLTVARAEGSPRTLTEQIAAARTAHPTGTLTAVRPGEGDATTQVDFALPELGEKQHTVYVDRYTGAVDGQLTTWFGTTPLRTWFDDLHRNLHLGAVGRHYSELAASWLWVLALGGLLLWWRRQRGNRSARRLLTPDLTAKKGVRRIRGWHAATGVWLAVGLLFLSATGLTWSRYAGANFGTALDSLSAGTPVLSTALTGAAPAAGGGHHSTAGAAVDPVPADPAAADLVLRTARDNGLTGPVEIGVPADSASAWSVAQKDELWPIRMDRIAVDGDAGSVVDRSDFADWPLPAKLSRYGIAAHMGQLFGVANQVLLALLAIGLTRVIVWGYRMWWQRRPTRADRRAIVGAPPVGRGAWQQLPAWAIVVGVPLVLAVGWVAPLLGLPLAAFLLADLAIGAVRSRPAARRLQRSFGGAGHASGHESSS
ncbi:PepSY-associated TM helix domain-containing protein [Micromonosporaceae bacterium Da 78-11]